MRERILMLSLEMFIREGAIILISVINFIKCCNADSNNFNKNSVILVCQQIAYDRNLLLTNLLIPKSQPF